MAVTINTSKSDFISMKKSGADIEKISKRLRKMKKSMTRKIRVIGLRKGAAPMVKMSKALAPRSGFHATHGPYKGPSRGKKKTTNGYRLIMAVVDRDPGPGASSLGIGVHYGAFYLRFHETGYFAVGRKTRTYKTKSGNIRFTRRPRSVRGVRQYSKGTTWVPPQPYLRPSLYANKDRSTNIAMRYYWDKLTQGLPKVRA